MAANLKVGAGKTEIPIFTGVPMAGYATRTGRATGIHDPLYARIILFDSNSKQYALVALDLLKVDKNLVTQIRQELNAITGIPSDSITVTATHTHSGPAGIWEESAHYDPAFATSISANIASLAREVWRNRVPAKLGIATGELHNLARNRNNPDGFYDPAVGVIRVDSLDGRVIALIINYACHPTVLGERNLLFSRDFPGFTVDLIEKESTDGAQVTIFTNGAAGDISTRYTRTESTFAEGKRLGELLAKKVLMINKALTASPEWEINSYSKEISLPVRRVSLQSTSKILSDARRELRDLESKRVNPGRIRTAQTAVQAAELMMDKLVKEQKDLNENHPGIRLQPENLPAEIQVIYLTGETKAALIVLPGEISSGIGQRIKEIIHEVRGIKTNHIFILGYGNGHIGYLLSPESYHELNYDSLMSKVDSGAAELIAETVRTLGLKGCEENAGKKIL